MRLLHEYYQYYALYNYMRLCNNAHNLGAVMQDIFHTTITASDAATASAWNATIESYLDFSGSPVKKMQEISDPAFLRGPVFCAAMKLLSGVDPRGSSITQDVTAMRKAVAGSTPTEKQHAAAIEHMLQGEFSAAARTWDAVLADDPNDILAHKCAHETWFLVGDTVSMRAGSTAAIERLTADDPAFAIAAAQHGFALEETGDYAAAESWGRLALDMRPSDCWALHCLAHVYETQNRHHDALALFDAKKPFWTNQNLLNAHIWWHLALRQIEVGDFTDSLGIFDTALSEVPASDRFRLTDGTSLLWRLELAGVDVGDRWRLMAEKWARNAELHTNAFLDLHAALAFSRCPDSPAAEVFFDSLSASFDGDTSENAQTFQTVVKPLAQAFAQFRSNTLAASAQIEALLPQLHRIGGSIVQREIVERSYSSALLATGQAAKAEGWLAPKLDQHPNTPWVLRASADAAAAQGNLARETLLRRRSDLMFAEF
ncbi:tetratricopeptide repeat protein [Yoonia vestfoldensis]|jgi:tetratricopeptide (TPR) repeat protein|uniref:Tetratricopeptide repeat protein 38 n=1 Tax=Yoonia vestfoldensis TaxID=245188 RepID=A0A1Y0EE08_9RHOB|nr:tetratricopeptide repeat protein [Yoonia vestfoldensis]ARU01591.1 beta-barrel assembly-enhancing protease [Yoonia vestfoldensis]